MLDNKFFRRLALLWSMMIITWVIWKVFTYHPDIPTNTVTALGIVVGLLATVIAFYKWSRYYEDKSKRAETMKDENDVDS